MYLGTDDSYTYYGDHGQQRHTEGDFLILLDTEGVGKPTELKAVIRQVALKQLGHYMMGTARIGGESFTVSGAYGGNGLPLSVPDDIYEGYGLLLPDDLFEEWKTGGGHNSAGTEAEPLREWAIENYDRLTPSS